MTYLIQDLSPSYLSYELGKLKTLMAKQPVIHPCDVGWVTVADLGATYEAFIEHGRVTYFARHKALTSPFPAGRQVLIARLETTVNNYDAPETAFFDMLLPQYGCMIADTAQTQKGRRFWLRALAHAFELVFYVYYIDARVDDKPRVKRLLSMRDVWAFQEDVWGETAQHEATFVAISTKRIPETF